LNNSLKFFLSLAGTIVFVALGAGATLWMLRQIDEAAVARMQSYSLIIRGNAVLSALRDAETGQRGFALTGDEAFLAPYLAVQDKVAGELTALQEASLNPAARQHLHLLVPLVAEKMEEMAQVIDLRRKQDLPAVIARVAEGRGKRLMDSIRVEFAAYTELMGNEVERHNAEFRSRMQTLMILLVTAGFIMLLLALASTYYVHREGRHRLAGLVHAETEHRLARQTEAALILAQANAALQVSEGKLAVTLHSIGDGVIAMDVAGRVTLMNPVAEQLTGWTQAEGTLRPVEEVFRIISQETRLPAVSPVGATLAHGTTLGLVNHTLLLHRQGRECPIADSCAPIRDEAGRVVGAVLVFRDVTKEEAVRRALSDQQAYTRSLFETNIDALMVTDPAGLVTDVNEQMMTLTGCTRAELVGAPFQSRFTDPARAAASLALVLDQKKVTDYELVARAKHGPETFVSYNATPFYDGEGRLRGMFAAARDISERRQTMERLGRTLEELNLANANLAETSRLKDEFLANMSHELRTPLNAILGLSESLLEQLTGPLTPRQVKSVTTIGTSGQHLLALINDILDLSKIEAGKLELNLETVNLDEFCQSCLLFVRTQAMQKQIGVAFEHDGRRGTFPADARRFKQVLVNLLTNAVKFTPPGGNIGLRVATPEGEGRIRFTVWDTGIGIAPAESAKLFQAFSQIDSGLSRAQEGTGLGLALVGKLVELHGGSVVLESEPGKGSRFIVTLPLVESPASVQPWTPGASVAAACQDFHRVLIIEDDPTSGAILAGFLAELGLDSRQHLRGETAISAVLRERPDLILLDILLPGESGWVVLAKLKEHPETRGIPVIVVSFVEEPEKSRALGALAHLTKPVTRAQLAKFFRPVGAGPTPRLPEGAGLARARPLLLLAEDNKANIETIGGYLEDKGYALFYAMNGLQAVKLARELRPALILMDIQMPVLDGLAAIRQIREEGIDRAVPIIALTALVMPGDRERCLAAGATDYMSKPVGLKSLAALVDKLTANPGRP